MQEVYEEKYGKKPVTQVIHAGLECGIILGAAPDMDVVSFGPTIVNPHSPSEYVEIESVGKFYDYLLEVLAKLK